MHHLHFHFLYFLKKLVLKVHPLVGSRKPSVKSISGTNHHHHHDSSTKLTNQSSLTNSTTYGLNNSRKNNTRQRDRVKSKK
ncbi:unnamed protein product [Schistosoma curassoni]|uniref:Uncharacterized protein n=1 Tax=Schistosoma curassoni TaxID=6186 RepID=A0A3P7XPR7_9TREM|nr:unnamed protein product [Schistosoma curassoni]